MNKVTKRNIIYTTVYCISLIVLSQLSVKLLGIEQKAIDLLLESYSTIEIEDIFQLKNKWSWVSFLFVPLYILLKVFILTIILDIGMFFFQERLPKKKYFKL